MGFFDKLFSKKEKKENEKETVKEKFEEDITPLNHIPTNSRELIEMLSIIDNSLITIGGRLFQFKARKKVKKEEYIIGVKENTVTKIRFSLREISRGLDSRNLETVRFGLNDLYDNASGALHEMEEIDILPGFFVPQDAFREGMENLKMCARYAKMYSNEIFNVRNLNSIPNGLLYDEKTGNYNFEDLMSYYLKTTVKVLKVCENQLSQKLYG